MRVNILFSFQYTVYKRCLQRENIIKCSTNETTKPIIQLLLRFVGIKYIIYHISYYRHVAKIHFIIYILFMFSMRIKLTIYVTFLRLKLM